MNFELTSEQKDIRQLVRQFAEKEIKPHVKENDAKSIFPTEQVKALGEMGLMGVCIPTEYGGSGMDAISYAIVIEELSRVCPSTAVITSVNNSLVSEVIKNFGTEDQKQKYLIPLAKGEHLGAYLSLIHISEPTRPY